MPAAHLWVCFHLREVGLCALVEVTACKGEMVGRFKIAFLTISADEGAFAAC